MTIKEYEELKRKAVGLIFARFTGAILRFTKEQQDLIDFFEKHKKAEDIKKYGLIRKAK